MRKLLLGLVGLVLIGAGCIPVANAPVNGKWKVAFDLPAGWVMVAPYEVPGKDEKMKPLNFDVKRDDSEVYLQSTDKAICWSSGGPCAEGSVLNEGEQIRVTMLDARRKLDFKELTDLGKGFYLKAGPTTPADGPELLARDVYYFVSDTNIYEFKYIGDAAAIKKIILSAKVVTHFTDRPTIEVKN